MAGESCTSLQKFGRSCKELEGWDSVPRHMYHSKVLGLQ